MPLEIDENGAGDELKDYYYITVGTCLSLFFVLRFCPYLLILLILQQQLPSSSLALSNIIHKRKANSINETRTSLKCYFLYGRDPVSPSVDPNSCSALHGSPTLLVGSSNHSITSNSTHYC
jgi:hypothetical protein